MKRRTVLKAAALVPAITLPLAVPVREPGHMLVRNAIALFYDDDGHEIARVEKDGRVVREHGVVGLHQLRRCARYFWDYMRGDADDRLIGGNWPLSVSMYNFSDPPWSVEMPANGSIKKMRFENVDPAARFFWSMIQAARPAALTS